MDFEGKNIDIEEAMKMLEKIVRKLENGKENLQESVELFKRGMELCSKCEDELKEVKLQLQYFENENNEILEE